MMKKIFVLYNQAAGDNEGLQLAKLFEQKVHRALPKVDVFLQGVNKKSDPQVIHQKGLTFGLDTLVIIGGDGSIHHGIKTFQKELPQVTIGILAAGTVNNLAKALALPSGVDEQIQTIINHKVKAIDYGQVNQDIVLSTITIGLLADSAAKVTQAEKQKLGVLAFIKTFWHHLIKRHRPYLTIQTAKEHWEGKAQILTINLTNSAGGFQKFNSEATVDDGFFHVTLLPKLSLVKLFLALPKIASGKFHELADVKYFKTTQVSIASRDLQTRSRIDGDPAEDLPLKLTMHHQAISVFVPKN